MSLNPADSLGLSSTMRAHPRVPVGCTARSGVPRSAAVERRAAGRTGASAALALVLALLARPGRGSEPACEELEPNRPPKGCFTERDGTFHNPTIDYRARLAAARPDHLRTMVEEVLFLGVGAAWYWLDQDRNLADWDYPSWEQRFTLEAWRLDNNHFPINFLGHPLEGALYFSFARANDHNVWVATTYAYSTSFLWEFLFEFREKISINDMLVTPLAGVPIGEFAHKLWRHFSRLPARPTLSQQVVAATLGFPIWIHRLMDGTAQPVEEAEDEHRFSAPFRTHLEAGYRASFHDFGGQAMTHGGWVGGRLSTIPGEGRPGSFELFFHEADIVTLSLAAGLGAEARELDLLADALLLGAYVQTIDLHGSGHAAAMGLGLAYRYRFQDFDGYNDRLAVLHLPGPAADYVFGAGWAQLAVQARFNADFAAVHSAAFSRWARDAVGPGDRAKSILRKHNYYYGWGGSARFATELRVGLLDLRGGLVVGVYDSQEGLDRTQDEITLDPDAVDRLLEWEAALGFTVPATSLRLAAGWRSTRRQSRVEQETVDRTLQTWSASLGFGL